MHGDTFTAPLSQLSFRWRVWHKGCGESKGDVAAGCRAMGDDACCVLSCLVLVSVHSVTVTWPSQQQPSPALMEQRFCFTCRYARMETNGTYRFHRLCPHTHTESPLKTRWHPPTLFLRSLRANQPCCGGVICFWFPMYIGGPGFGRAGTPV